MVVRPKPQTIVPAKLNRDLSCLWQDMSLAIPYWDSKGSGQTPRELINPTADLGGIFASGKWADTPRGQAYGDSGFQSYSRSDATTYSTQWTCDDGATVQFVAWQAPSLPVSYQRVISLLRNGVFQQGSWAIQYRSNAVRVVYDAGSGLNTGTFNASPKVGFNSLLAVRDGAAETVQVCLNGEDLGTQSLAAGSISDIGATPLEIMCFGPAYVLSAFVARGVLIAPSTARLLHKDPWAWVRPRPLLRGLSYGSAPSGEGVGEASGSATVTGVGQASVKAIGASSGAATVTGVGSSTGTSEGVGSSVGQATVDGIGKSRIRSFFSVTGLATVTGSGAAEAETTGSAAGAATVTGVGQSSGAGEGVGQAIGVATVTGLARSEIEATFAVTGQATVTGFAGGDAITSEWDRQMSDHQIPGSFGWYLQKALTTGKFIGLKD